MLRFTSSRAAQRDVGPIFAVSDISIALILNDYGAKAWKAGPSQFGANDTDGWYGVNAPLEVTTQCNGYV